MAVYLELQTYAGGRLEDVFHEMVAVAVKLGIPTLAKVNGIEVIAHPGDSPFAIERGWRAALERGLMIVTARNNRDD